MINFNHVSTECFDDLSFELPQGKVCKVLVHSYHDVRTFMDTLLYLTRPVLGDIFLFNKNMGALSEDERIDLFKEVAMVWGNGGLVSNLKVRENVFLPLAYHKGENPEAFEEKVEALFLRLDWKKEGLSSYMGRLPGTLPLHEKKLIGLIRAMLCEPELVIYESLFDGLGIRQANKLLKITTDFHDARPKRTSIYISCDEDALSKVKGDLSLMQKGREFVLWD